MPEQDTERELARLFLMGQVKVWFATPESAVVKVSAEDESARVVVFEGGTAECMRCGAGCIHIAAASLVVAVADPDLTKKGDSHG